MSTAFDPQGGHLGNVVTAFSRLGKTWGRGQQVCFSLAWGSLCRGRAEARAPPRGPVWREGHPAWLGGLCGEQRGAREKTLQAARRPRVTGGGGRPRGPRHGQRGARTGPGPLAFPSDSSFHGDSSRATLTARGHASVASARSELPNIPSPQRQPCAPRRSPLPSPRQPLRHFLCVDVPVWDTPAKWDHSVWPRGSGVSHRRHVIEGRHV